MLYLIVSRYMNVWIEYDIQSPLGSRACGPSASQLSGDSPSCYQERKKRRKKRAIKCQTFHRSDSTGGSVQRLLVKFLRVWLECFDDDDFGTHAGGEELSHLQECLIRMGGCELDQRIFLSVSTMQKLLDTRVVFLGVECVSDGLMSGLQLSMDSIKLWDWNSTIPRI